jgi:hypothetical protein
MSMNIRRVEYFNLTIRDRPGEAYKLLARLQAEGINLFAFNVVPLGGDSAQIVLFPESGGDLKQALTEYSELRGPQPAFLVQGDDELGALVDIHQKLFEGEINVYASAGVTDGRGGYGYILYVREEDFSRAAQVLGI